MFNLGSPLGAIFIGLIVDKFGRRPSILISILPSVVGWLLLCLDFQRPLTFSGRILTGVNAGCMYVGQVYAAECIIVNHPNWRNSLNTWQAVALSFGMLLCYAFGCFLPYQGVAAIAASISIVLIVINYQYLPESPKWLYHKGLIKEAKRSEKLLGIHQPILKDIETMDIPFHITDTSYFITVMRKLKRKDVYKPLLVMTALYITVMFSGGAAVTAYMVDIIGIDSETGQSTHTIKRYFSREHLDQAVPTTTDPSYELGLIASILVLIAVFLVSFVVRYTGIKKAYYFSSAGMSIGLILLGISLFHFDNKSVQNFINVLHVVSVWCIAFFYGFGVSNIPASILGEVFPHDAKGFASIPAIVFCLSAAAAVKFHPYLFIYYGGGLYFLYALILVTSTFIVAFFVPETVGRTLDELGEFFSKWLRTR